MIPLDKLILEAKRAAELSYSPYSNFRIGAAVEVDGDLWYSGTNVENASYGLTICAERVAICKAVSHGHTKLKRVVVYGPSQEVRTGPCGACRQFIKEFADEDTRIHGVCQTDSTLVWTMEELLPKAFGPENLRRKIQIEDDVRKIKKEEIKKAIAKKEAEALGLPNSIKTEAAKILDAQSTRDPIRDCYFCGQFPCPDHAPHYDALEKTFKEFSKK